MVFVKGAIGYDDALDTFGVHAVGGTTGAIITGILAVPAKLADGKVNPDAVNPNLAANVDKFIHSGTLVVQQVAAVAISLVEDRAFSSVAALPRCVLCV
ncbi:hypothetical protein CfE428DRAFT_6612 [Chthoniobacter flavus Ellin428]|uniref:Ammonium transporter AmtB-like domain-containing protein n=1 Tax=Chthoniobacter flavus Ellin428 TaxID=497964 RepID=B4DCH1_9BACT|nr:ammonium transporter [Chthoniobacter flavus]EDY15847.1 hypothetical protein CfE428DRAFT_6612 [Chthoniobacter flavus Ellin428]